MCLILQDAFCTAVYFILMTRICIVPTVTAVTAMRTDAPAGSMRLQKVQDALNKKNIKFEYTEEDGCGSLDFMFRGLKFHVWEYEDNGWGAETNIYAAGRSEDIDGDYEEKISAEILSWPDMINN